MNIRQYAFVTAYLKHRDAIIAYKLATGSESTNLRSLQSAANRMLNKPGVREEIESVLKATRAEVEAEIAETTRTELMTIQRKREILAMIINGQYTVMVRAKGKNCNPCTYFNSPTISQVLTGIREDNKMAGHYAVVTTTRGKLQQITTDVCPPSAAEASAKEATQDTCETQQSATELCPSSPAEASAKEATPTEALAKETAQDNQELQHPSGSKRESATTTNHESPLSTEWRGAGGEVLAPDTRLPAVATAKEGEMQQSATTPINNSPFEGRQEGCPLAPDTRELQQSSTTELSPLTAEAPAKAVKLKKLLTETTRLAQAPIPATLRPFFEAYETHRE